jgi:hypothetical protein
LENRKEEHIIEDLLFEISAREVLAKSERASTSVIRPIRKYLAYAAVFLALIATLFILNRGGSSMDAQTSDGQSIPTRTPNLAFQDLQNVRSLTTT